MYLVSQFILSLLFFLKEFEGELAQLRGCVSSCVSKGKQLKETCHNDDKGKVEAKLEELNTGNKYISSNYCVYVAIHASCTCMLNQMMSLYFSMTS